MLTLVLILPTIVMSVAYTSISIQVYIYLHTPITIIHADTKIHIHSGKRPSKYMNIHPFHIHRGTVKPLITNTSKEFIKCRILHFLIMLQIFSFLIKWLYGALLNCFLFFFRKYWNLRNYSIKLIEKLSRRYLINSSDVFVIKGFTVCIYIHIHTGIYSIYHKTHTPKCTFRYNFNKLKAKFICQKWKIHFLKFPQMQNFIFCFCVFLQMI